MGKTTLKLLIALTAAGTLSAGAASAARTGSVAQGLPGTCPATSVIRAALRQNITHVTSYAGPISAATFPGMGPAADSAHYKKTQGTERTCTYSGAPTGPITTTFVSPITLQLFTSSRASLRKSGVAVALVDGIGDTAWAARAGGLLFVLKGTLEIVISAPRTSIADLKALAGQIV